VKAAAERLHALCLEMDLPGAAMSADRILVWFSKAESAVSASEAVPIPPHMIEGVANECMDVRGRIQDELEARSLYVVPRRLTSLLDSAKPLFGREVDANFPSAAPEIAEAGACLALGRYSAAVFHLMRTLEVGLTVLAASLNVTVKNPNWENVLNDITSAVNKITPATHGASWKEYQKYCSEAAASFLVFKNAWRSYAMHLHERYDQERALAIWDGVKVFMNDLAKRLKE
jgi:hypothetical protein